MVQDAQIVADQVWKQPFVAISSCRNVKSDSCSLIQQVSDTFEGRELDRLQIAKWWLSRSARVDRIHHKNEKVFFRVEIFAPSLSHEDCETVS